MVTYEAVKAVLFTINSNDVMEFLGSSNRQRPMFVV